MCYCVKTMISKGANAIAEPRLEFKLQKTSRAFSCSKHASGLSESTLSTPPWCLLCRHTRVCGANDNYLRNYIFIYLLWQKISNNNERSWRMRSCESSCTFLFSLCVLMSVCNWFSTCFSISEIKCAFWADFWLLKHRVVAIRSWIQIFALHSERKLYSFF